MFDFFIHIAYEMRGIDTETAKKEMFSREMESRTKDSLFSNWMRRFLFALGILYLVFSAVIIFMAVGTTTGSIYIMKHIVFSFIDVVILISLVVGKRKGEIVALVSIVVFLFISFASAAIG